MTGRSALAVLAFLATVVAAAAEPARWEGEWHTFWRGGQALMVLEQDGARVTGTYRPGNGQIVATARDGQLTGSWAEEGASGGLSFAMGPNGDSFAGRFDNGEYWNGQRIPAGSFSPTPFFRDDTPREAFRTALVAGNAAFEGDTAAFLVLEPRLLYLGPQTDESDRLDRRNLLYRILDMSTFRINDLPAEGTDGVARFEVGPAGGDWRTTVTMLQDEDGSWRLAVPPLADLRERKGSLLDALGYEDYAEYRQDRANSPRGVMHRFLMGVAKWDRGGDEAALSTLDLSRVPETLRAVNGPLFVDYLRQIIDRIGYVIWQEIPDDPDQRTPYVHYAHADGSITIAPQPGEDGGVRWRFTADTIDTAPAVFEAVQLLPLAPGLTEPPPLSRYFAVRERVKSLSPALLERPLGLATWQWIALALGVAVAAVLGWLAGLAVRLVWHLLPDELMGGGEAAARRRRGLVHAVRFIAAGAVLYTLFGGIGLPSNVLTVLAAGAALVVCLGVVMVLYRLAGVVGAYFYRRAEDRSGHVDEIVTSLATGIVKIAVITGGIIVAADIVGLPYEGVIAGLGVGGLALAIAARDTVSNFFGAAVLLADRPFKRGDFVELDGRFAVVEEVGLRSSRLRLFDDSLMVIPNGKIADGTVINFGRRRKRQILLTLSVTYDTPREKLDTFVSELDTLLAGFPLADAEHYVGLTRFAESAIEIDLWCYVWVTSYAGQVEAKHRLIGDIVTLADRLGVSFALPARTLHLAASADEAVAGGPGAAGPFPPAAAAGERLTAAPDRT